MIPNNIITFIIPIPSIITILLLLLPSSQGANLADNNAMLQKKLSVESWPKLTVLEQSDKKDLCVGFR